MLKHYLTIALRNLAKHKGYTFINISGLALGLACCFFILLYVRQERSFDRFHQHAPRLYRLLHVAREGEPERSAISASGYATHLKQEFPELEVVRFFTANSRANLKAGSETRTVDGFFYADSAVFRVFTFPLRQGDPATALAAPNTMVLSPAAAEAWFGRDNPVGKTLTLLRGDLKLDLRITGVLQPLPKNSHLQFDYLISFHTITAFMGEQALAEYTNFNYYTYLLLPAGAAPEHYTSRFPEFLQKYRNAEAANSTALALQPITDIHLTTDVRWDIGSNSDKRHLYIFSAVAALILFIACINFVNLATARAAQRAKEIGVRKVVGADRGTLLLQLFGESLLAGILAVGLALALLQTAAPLAGELGGGKLAVEVFANPGLLLLLAGLGLAASVLAAIYPALILSGFNPAKVLKGLVTRGAQGAALRKGLIVAQFSIAVFLLIAILTVRDQLAYMKTRDLGFNKEQVLHLNLSGAAKQRFAAFRQSLLAHPGVRNVALVGSVPGRVGTSRGYVWPGKEEPETRSFYTMLVDEETVPTLGLQIVQGRNFSREFSTDAGHAYILNETAVRELGWEDPVGRPFRVWDEEMGQVIGVVKDFHFKSLHQKIEPLVLDIKPEWSWSAAIRLAPQQTAAVLPFLAEQWRACEPDLPLDYRFLDADFDRLYQTEERLGRLFSAFTFLAFFVACLGLLGLASFTAEQRTKEIGIRKVLGATVPSILLLLSKEFSRLVLLAFALAVPVAYYATNTWLENFAYRLHLGPRPFLLGGGLALAIALLTVSLQATKAAVANPVKALRYE